MTEYEAAFAGARVAEPDVWTLLQGAKAAASLEIDSLLESWRDEARQIIENALKRLPSALRQPFLEEGLAKEMAAPLEILLGVLDVEKEPARVAALPERARNLVRDLGEAIRAEAEKRAAQATAAPPGPPREVRRVRIADVVIVRRVRTVPEWEEVARRLDERVQKVLEEFDVEFD